MDEQKEVKRRGRPPKPKDHEPQQSVPLRSEEGGRTGSDLAGGSQRGRSSGAGSRKRGVKYIGQARSEAAIDLPYLASCDPAVRPVDLTRMIQRGKKIHEPTLKLFRALQSVPLGTIPSELKAGDPFVGGRGRSSVLTITLDHIHTRKRHSTQIACRPG